MPVPFSLPMSDPAERDHNAKSIRQRLANWLQAEGELRLGQVIVRPAPPGFKVGHCDDTSEPPERLTLHTRPEAARELAKLDAAGNFRALKSSPTLQRGWRLELPTLADLHLALDFLYPAALANWFRLRDGAARPVPLREMLGRQTGIYRITAAVTDPEAAGAIAATCRSDSACLRRIAWPLAEGQPIPGLPSEKTCLSPTSQQELPLVCLEGCALLLGALRQTVRSRPKTDPPSHSA
jgi:sirohydrochlorin cobaltochelatase